MADCLSEGQRRRLKAGAGELTALAGGPAIAARLLGRSAGAVSRWAGPDYPDTIPLDCALALEAHVGSAPVTAVMAELAGFRLAALGDEIETPHASRVMTLMADSAAAVAAYAAAAADGHVTPREATDVLAALTAAARAVADAKRAIGPHLTPVRS